MGATVTRFAPTREGAAAPAHRPQPAAATALPNGGRPQSAAEPASLDFGPLLHFINA
jgi:hypothetical protein